MDTQKGISWPGWEIVRRIGSGSFGTVYEIQRDIYGDIEKGALKVITIPHNEDEVDYLRCSGLDDASITRTFHQQVGDIAKEYKLMAQLRENPNIVRCDDFRDIQHDDGLGWDIYIKMELLTPLMKCLDQVSSEEQIIHMGMDICNALIDCQKKNIIHRDIKPQNVFVSESGRFKLGDFGIARTIERTTHATAGIGTYSYMAPEVERNEPYGKTADIYSLGLMMYWLLNDRRGPFMPLPPAVPKYGDEELARRRRFSGEQIPNPKNGSDKLKAIVMRACSFKPENRFESADELYAALSGMVEKHTVVPTTECLPSDQGVQIDEDLTIAGPHWENKTEPRIVVEQAPEPTVDDDATVGPAFAKNKAKVETPEPQKNVVSKPNTGRETSTSEKAPEEKQTGVALPNGFWRCVCGRENAAYVSSCACGINKYELRLIPGQSLTAQPQSKQTTSNTHSAPSTIPQGFWNCTCGRLNAPYVSSCACGASKRDVVGKGIPVVTRTDNPKTVQADSDEVHNQVESSDDTWRKSEAAHRAWLKSIEKKED